MILIFFLNVKSKLWILFIFYLRLRKTGEDTAFDFVSNMILRLTFFHFICKIEWGGDRNRKLTAALKMNIQLFICSNVLVRERKSQTKNPLWSPLGLMAKIRFTVLGTVGTQICFPWQMCYIPQLPKTLPFPGKLSLEMTCQPLGHS